jgi:hypothetical protein
VRQIADGQHLVARYNCTGCHIIEGAGGNIRRLYEDNLSMAPPNLLGEGQKVQEAWLFNFLQAPVTIRPWLHVRMPTFGLTPQETTQVVRYFAALDHKEVPFAHVSRATLRPDYVQAGELLASKEYLSCWSCHVRGDQNPEGSPDSWALDRPLAARSAEAHAGHQDAHVLRRPERHGRAAGHPGRQRRRADRGAARLRHVARPAARAPDTPGADGVDGALTHHHEQKRKGGSR